MLPKVMLARLSAMPAVRSSLLLILLVSFLQTLVEACLAACDAFCLASLASSSCNGDALSFISLIAASVFFGDLTDLVEHEFVTISCAFSIT